MMPREGPIGFDEFPVCRCGASMARWRGRVDWRPFEVCHFCARDRFAREDPVSYRKAVESAAFSLRVLKERPQGWGYPK